MFGLMRRQKTIGWLVCVTLLCNPLLVSNGAQAACIASPDRHAASLQDLRQMMNAARSLRQAIDRTAFDLTAVLDAADYDAEALVAYVKANIAFEQYSGALRGPEGTLLSRSGNALDQALLLGRLLNDAGYDARIARSQIEPAAAQELMLEMFRPKTASPAIVDTQTLAKSLTAMGAQREFVQQVMDKAQVQGVLDSGAYPQLGAVNDNIALLRKQLKSHGVSLGGSKERIVTEARDYFWIQYQSDNASGWLDVHPAFSAAPSFKPQFAEVFVNSIPETLQHKLRFQVFIEQAVSGKLETKAITQPWTRPTANLNAQPLVFGNLSNEMTSDVDFNTDLVDGIEKAGWFIPTFNGAMAPDSSFFDTSGNLIDPMAANSAGAGIFKTVADSFARATEQLDKDALPKLTAQWLEFTLISPDGKETSYRRTTMDRLGPAKRLANAVPKDLAHASQLELAPLIQRHTFMVGTGAMSRARVLDFVLEHFLQSEPLLEALIDQASGKSAEPKVLERALRDVPEYWAGLPTLLAQFDSAQNLTADRVLYRSAPTLIVHRQGPGAKGQYIQAIDLVQNPRRGFAKQKTGVQFDAQAVLAAGVWDTQLEGGLLPEGDNTYNTATNFAAAKTAAAAIKVVTSTEELAALAVSDDAKASMGQDLRRGTALVVAEHSMDGVSGWWRIDPATGNTVGQIDDGRGSEFVEYLKGISLGLGIIKAIMGLMNCTSGYTVDQISASSELQEQMACCGAMTLIFAAYGYLMNTVSLGAGSLFGLGTSILPAGSICS